MKKSIAFLTFEKWHGRKNIGSSRIRANWLIKYMEDAEIYKQGEKYDTLIFQKVYWPEYMKAYKGTKILDMCDADFLSGQPLVSSLNEVDAVTCSTQALADQVKHFTKKPVIVIPDRQDLDFHKIKKVHKGGAKSVVWFGYIGNSEVLKPTLFLIKRLKLKLCIISEGTFYEKPPLKKEDIINVKWDIETVNQEIIKHDICLLPRLDRGNYKYKSNNKVTTSWALGMPVAETPDELKKFLDPEERRKEARKRWKEVQKYYDVRRSVSELEELIKKINASKRKRKETD